MREMYGNSCFFQICSQWLVQSSEKMKRYTKVWAQDLHAFFVRMRGNQSSGHLVVVVVFFIMEKRTYAISTFFSKVYSAKTTEIIRNVTSCPMIFVHRGIPGFANIILDLAIWSRKSNPPGDWGPQQLPQQEIMDPKLIGLRSMSSLSTGVRSQKCPSKQHDYGSKWRCERGSSFLKVPRCWTAAIWYDVFIVLWQVRSR